MRLFGFVNGRIDRHDRAEWLTPPFNQPRLVIATLGSVVAAQAPTPTAVNANVFSTGANEARTFSAGAAAGQVDA